MSFVIYNPVDTVILVNTKTNAHSYKSLSAAKAALTRMTKSGVAESDVLYSITDATNFSLNIEKMIPVQNLMTGKIMMERANTPRSCSVGSELFFSM